MMLRVIVGYPTYDQSKETSTHKAYLRGTYLDKKASNRQGFSSPWYGLV